MKPADQDRIAAVALFAGDGRDSEAVVFGVKRVEVWRWGGLKPLVLAGGPTYHG